MTARRTGLIVTAFLLAATGLQGASQVEVDPHELYDRSREYLADGELRAAATALARLGTLIAKRPDWDPEGTFAKELLPPLQARLKRLQEIARQLDDFTVTSLQELQPPDIKKDISTVRDYTDWATTVIQRLRDQREQIINAALTDPEERAFLTHTESYERTERLLEIDVLKRLADTAGDDILGLLAGDPELESVLVRFRQLKRSLMQMASERDQLEADINKSREHDEVLLGVVAALVTDDASPGARSRGRHPTNVGDLFAHFLDGQAATLRRRIYATPEEHAALRADLERYRRFDTTLHAAGLGPDEKGRLEALSKMVEDLPVEGGGAKARGAAGPATLTLLGALILATAALGFLAAARGRRLASLEGAAGRRAAGARAGIRSAGVDSKAV